MHRYEDGSSCDEDFNNSRGDAEGEHYLQQAWYVEQLVQEHLRIHPGQWDAEDLFMDLCNDMDRKGIDLDDYEQLNVIRELLNSQEVPNVN